jgi:hypothetical protein
MVMPEHLPSGGACEAELMDYMVSLKGPKSHLLSA